jgi:hypothetical protein
VTTATAWTKHGDGVDETDRQTDEGVDESVATPAIAETLAGRRRLLQALIFTY